MFLSCGISFKCAIESFLVNPVIKSLPHLESNISSAVFPNTCLLASLPVFPGAIVLIALPAFVVLLTYAALSALDNIALAPVLTPEPYINNKFAGSAPNLNTPSTNADVNE